MRLHLGSNSESRLCLSAIVAIMVLTGSAILIMGLHFYLPSKAVGRFVMAAPF